VVLWRLCGGHCMTAFVVAGIMVAMITVVLT
jgi:hypothetical protein